MYITARLPAPVITMTGNNENGFGNITWNKIDGAEKYVVYRSRTVNGVYVAISDVRGTSFTDFSAEQPGEYFYKVVAYAVNEKATGSFSEVASVTVTSAYAEENEIETIKTIERQREKQFDEKNVFTSKTGLINII